MKILETVKDFDQKGVVLTIGNFDGVHLGHIEILSIAKKLAEQKKTSLAAMTFDPHPAYSLHPQKSPEVLTPLVLKTLLLAECGIDYLFVLKSSWEFLRLSPQEFVEEFLIKTIRPSIVVEGTNFNFGCRRSGNVGTLQQFGKENGFEVKVVPTKQIEVSAGTLTISSTAVRQMISDGNVADAAIALARPYRLAGHIVSGQGRGRQLGFPTANMNPMKQIIPAEGVYAGSVEIGQSAEEVCSSMNRTPSVFSIGRPKNYGNSGPLMIEAHLLTKNVGDLYGKWMAMDFVNRLRDRQVFKTDISLMAQITKDCERARQILGC